MAGKRMGQCTDIHERPVGFIPGRSTADAIVRLKRAIMKHRECSGVARGARGPCPPKLLVNVFFLQLIYVVTFF